MMDKYDEQIRQLRGLSDEWFDSTVLGQWAIAQGLFSFMGCGCLTQIKGGDVEAPSEELTRKILDDDRIPDSQYCITRSSLDVFAEYQREFDRDFGNDYR